MASINQSIITIKSIITHQADEIVSQISGQVRGSKACKTTHSDTRVVLLGTVYILTNQHNQPTNSKYYARTDGIVAGRGHTKVTIQRHGRVVVIGGSGGGSGTGKKENKRHK